MFRSKKSPGSLGNFLRAARFGFFFSNDHQCFIRISDGYVEGQFIIEACPEKEIRAHCRTTYAVSYFEWQGYEDKGQALLQSIQPLQGKIFSAYTRMTVDSKGQLVER